MRNEVPINFTSTFNFPGVGLIGYLRYHPLPNIGCSMCVLLVNRFSHNVIEEV